MAKHISPHPNSVQALTDEIFKGLQSGDMAVQAIDAVWDKDGTQQYTMRIIDVKRSAWLSRWNNAHSQWASATAVTVPGFNPDPPVIKPKPMEDLGVITEPIIGYRDFLLGTGHYPFPGLMSRNKSPWPVREPMRAFCRQGAFSTHDAPSLHCECGIYAFSKPDHSSLTNSDAIWGEVAMWGEVLICEEGYRSEFAYPKTLFLRDNGTKNIRWLQDVLADGYGVPVLLVEQREGKTAAQIMGEMLTELTKETS